MEKCDMNTDIRKLITIIIRGMKYTIALLEKWKRGEPV